ncbi:unnamed protein product [Prorocentrum cordatum]|uniref:Uncharacterized protein n=1 Tax=Prorocentrum cordatum TaxID=2364126 RepID=A0ABN9WF96_9DINO|nr:unnamed protein product [Polarella glacialis]
MALEWAFVTDVGPGAALPPDTAWRKLSARQSNRVAAGQDGETHSEMEKNCATGAIRKVDWAPLANRYLKGRRIILHTDRAKSYAMRVEGVLHDSVRHCKKRVKKNGKWVWVKPCYARLATHKLPCGRKLRTKAGSQVIDSVWKYIRSTLGGQTMVPNSETAATAIRSAQWLYWHRGKDLWAEMGSTFCANFWRR